MPPFTGWAVKVTDAEGHTVEGLAVTVTDAVVPAGNTVRVMPALVAVAGLAQAELLVMNTDTTSALLMEAGVKVLLAVTAPDGLPFIIHW